MSERLRVLVVDDDDFARTYVGKVLRRNGYDVVAVQSVPEARGVLAADQVDLVVTDLRMPGEDGGDLLRELRETYPDVPALMLTGVGDVGVAADILALGAYAYLLKPLEANELLIAVMNAVQRRKHEFDERAALAHLKEAVDERTRELHASREETLARLALAAELRDDATGRHLARMSGYAYRIAQALGLDAERCTLIRLASPLHDIGKIAIPDAVLLKPGSLDETEMRIMSAHPELGFRLLCGSGSELLDLAASIALTHHERLNGSGYPAGLIGDEIPLEGRIAAVADVYDAMTSERVYRAARTPAEARGELAAGRGTLYDPAVVDALFAILPAPATEDPA